MSNVIIGIIGVILFIGLAVAGATILGRDFMTASASTDAATVSSHLQQFAQGVQVLKVRRGVILPGTTSSNLGNVLVTNKALEEVPVNPVFASPYYGADINGGATTGELRIVFTSLGTSRQARDTCYAIEEAAGNANPVPIIDTPVGFIARSQAAPRLGCMNDADFGNQFVAYILT